MVSFLGCCESAHTTKHDASGGGSRGSATKPFNHAGRPCSSPVAERVEVKDAIHAHLRQWDLERVHYSDSLFYFLRDVNFDRLRLRFLLFNAFKLESF